MQAALERHVPRQRRIQAGATSLAGQKPLILKLKDACQVLHDTGSNDDKKINERQYQQGYAAEKYRAALDREPVA